MKQFYSAIQLMTVGAIGFMAVDAHAGTSHMIEGTSIRGPSGYYELCERSPELCPGPQARGESRSVRYSAAAFAELTRVNRYFNTTVKPVEDHIRYGVADRWERPRGGMGDCEDYVLAKREALMALGWPAEALLIGVAIGTSSPYHAVLVARTDQGEFVLDNMRDEVSDWRRSGLHFVIRQSSRDPRQWVMVENGAAPNITSTGGTR